MDFKVKIALSLAALISVLTAIAHLSCIVLGPACFEAQMAPPALVESATNGTMLAPVATLIIAGLFIVCGIFALSAIGIVTRLPYVRPALLLISVVCLLRGVATIPLSFMYADMVSTFSLSAGFAWFFTGLLFAYGYCYAFNENA